MARRLAAFPWIHPQAAGRTLNKLNFRPGWPPGTGARRIVVVPQQRFSSTISGVTLTGGQAQTIVNGSGKATISVGPQGLGVVWYPSSVIISTSTGAADTSTAACYIGSIAAQNLQGGQSYAGGGDTIGISVTSMAPGQLLIVEWTGAVPGATAVMNVLGTMDALAY
jgi:hypothetical protein